jgi:hypothetical protein
VAIDRPLNERKYLMKSEHRMTSAIYKASAVFIVFCLLQGCAWITPCFSKGEQCPQVKAQN